MHMRPRSRITPIAKWYRAGALLCAVGTTACGVARELSNVQPINFTSATVTGTVTDSITQQPLIGAEILLRDLNGDSSQDPQARTFSYAPDGSFRLESVAAGNYLLRASLRGYDTVAVEIRGVKVGERRSVSFRLKPN